MTRSRLVATAALVLFAAFAHAATTPDVGNWGFDLAGEDKSVKPGDNFFDFANGTAVKAIVIPPDRTNFGAFVELADLSEQCVHGILDAASAKATMKPDDAIGKAGAMYKAFMDEATVESLGAKPIQKDLAAVKALRTASDFATLQGRAQSGFQGSLFAMDIEPDAKDPTKYGINLGQSGLGLPDRDYYLTKQFADKKVKYTGFVTHMLSLAGWQDPAGAAAKIVALEQKIAEVSWPRAEERDPDRMYHPETLAELEKSAPGFDWPAFFKAADLGTPAQVVVGDDTAVAKIAALAGATPIETLKDWAAFHLVVNAAPMLSKDFASAAFEFNSHELQGQPQQRPRWKRAVTATEGALGEAVGQVYVAKFYPPDAQRKMVQLTHDLRDAFRTRLEKNSWMSAATKQKALEKLAAFDF